jgi:hypothetical protein
MEHLHPSGAHIIFANVTRTLGEVLAKNLWPNLTPMCDLPYGEGETTSLMGPKAYKTNNLFLIVR